MWIWILSTDLNACVSHSQQIDAREGSLLSLNMEKWGWLEVALPTPYDRHSVKKQTKKQVIYLWVSQKQTWVHLSRKELFPRDEPKMDVACKAIKFIKLFWCLREYWKLLCKVKDELWITHCGCMKRLPTFRGFGLSFLKTFPAQINLPLNIPVLNSILQLVLILWNAKGLNKIAGKLKRIYDLIQLSEIINWTCGRWTWIEPLVLD